MYTITKYELGDYDYAKETMTNSKAIKFLEFIKRGYLPDYNFTGSEDDFENYQLHIAMQKAIDKLEECMKDETKN